MVSRASKASQGCTLKPFGRPPAKEKILLYFLIISSLSFTSHLVRVHFRGGSSVPVYKGSLAWPRVWLSENLGFTRMLSAQMRVCR